MNWVVTTIIVPSDGSTAAEPQLASARALARATRARIVVAHVNELVRGHLGTHSVHGCEDQLESNVRRQVRDLKIAGVRADLEIVASTAEISRAIATLASKHGADLIVTRKQRSGLLPRWPFGSVSRRLIRLAPAPYSLCPDRP
jgi:nucleotide-binding universal stress UspA family protein